MVILNTTYLGRANIYTKLGMTITVHNVLKNNNNFKEHQIRRYLKYGQTIKKKS